MARINRVKRCRKTQGRCGRCSDEIKKGDPYIHWSPGFRGSKRIRCTKRECFPRASEMTANDKLSRLYGAQEDVEDALQRFTDALPKWNREEDQELIEEVFQALHDASDTAREVGEEYQEAADNINDTADGSPIAEECEEKALSCETWADALAAAADDAPTLREQKKGRKKVPEDAWVEEFSNHVRGVLEELEL